VEIEVNDPMSILHVWGIFAMANTVIPILGYFIYTSFTEGVNGSSVTDSDVAIADEPYVPPTPVC